ncbi:LamG-like jellyroll fold domain-containing protein [Polaribacter sp.]|uniref:LamG-like jellyroll fold domain-containing protein n=1 Tax=Polaribacter sp. TaxID=1920175 RepID=UPI004047154C
MKTKWLFLFLISSLGTFAQFAPQPSFFRTQREMPLVELTTTSTILVSSYGAVVNDGIDDRAAIQSAINAAVSAGTLQNPVKLLFDQGTYDLKPTSGTHSLTMNNAKGVLFDGNGAEFMIHNPVIGFLSTLKCTNTIIKDLSVDYVTLPFTQGKITKVDAANGFFEFKLDDGFPLPTEQHFVDSPQRWGMFKNAKGGIKEGLPNLIGHNRFFESIGTRTYRYGNQSSTTLSKVEVGDYFVHIARYNGSTIILNDGGKNLTYLNVTGYTSPAGCFNGRNSEEWNIINCKIKIKEGRVHSSNADVVHVSGGKIGPWVENNLFEGFSDDCVNLKYIKRQILEVHSPTQITVEFTIELNDKLEFYNPRDGVYLGDATVTNVQNLGSNKFKITLSNPINITNVNAEDHQLTDKAYIETKSNESFIFRNNIIRNSRRYGILIQAKYGLIENNLFQNLSSSAIRIENGVDWGEGFRADNIEIKNNRIENCGYDKTYIDESNSASISVDFAKLQSPCNISNSGFCGTTTSTWQAHSNIRILDNTITYNKRGLYLKNINGLTLKNNFICHRDEDITLANNESPVERTIFNTGNQNIEEYNQTTPSANLHFLLDEQSSQNINNTGSDNSVTLKINTTGGTITQGFFDPEIGYSFKINTINNGSLSLVNSNDNSNYPGPTQGAARTFAFWVKPEEAVFQTFLYSGGPTNGEVFTVQMEASGVVRVTDNNQNFVRMIDMPLNIGVWNHIVITLPSNNTLNSVQMYKNGIASTESYAGSNPLVNTSSNSVTFFPRYNGLASDIRFFDYKLCSSEVESIYNDRRTTLSIEDTIENQNDKIILYPTITSNLIYFNKPIQSIRVFNLLGKTIIDKENSDFSQLDVSHLSSGLYIVKINGNQTAKFYKN